MNGQHVLLILAHLFRARGAVVTIDDAVEYLSFRCRYGPPTEIRKMLAVAEQRGMIEREEDQIHAGFLFDRQSLSPNMTHLLNNAVRVRDNVEPMQ